MLHKNVYSKLLKNIIKYIEMQKYEGDYLKNNN